jgi:hypothetical protein
MNYLLPGADSDPAPIIIIVVVFRSLSHVHAALLPDRDHRDVVLAAHRALGRRSIDNRARDHQH